MRREKYDLDETEGGAAPAGGAPTNCVSSGAIATFDPLLKQKPLRRKPPVGFNEDEVTEYAFAGTKVFEVNPDIYQKCALGKNRYHRWERYVGDDDTGRAIRAFGKANLDKPIIVQNSNTGAMMYLRHRSFLQWRDA
jgi:hypothetical protein